MNKEELLQLFARLNINANEGITSDEISLELAETRVVFWDFLWEPVSASGSEYTTNVTYQISFFSYNTPRENKFLKDFLKELSKRNIIVRVSHEFVEKSKTWHSFFSLDILEKIL